MNDPNFGYYTVSKFEEISGKTEKAIRRKIEDGHWT